jgi:hypothetical protein
MTKMENSTKTKKTHGKQSGAAKSHEDTRQKILHNKLSKNTRQKITHRKEWGHVAGRPRLTTWSRRTCFAECTLKDSRQTLDVFATQLARGGNISCLVFAECSLGETQQTTLLFFPSTLPTSKVSFLPTFVECKKLYV